MLYELIALRLVHVMSGILWLGAGLFSAFFLVPALGRVPQHAGPVMGELQKRHLFTFLPVVALLTILSGARLLWVTSGGFSAAYVRSASGATFLAGGIAGTLAFVLAMFFVRPTQMRLGQLTASLAAAPDEAVRAALQRDIAAVRRRGAVGGNIAYALLIGSGVCMAVARYLVW